MTNYYQKFNQIIEELASKNKRAKLLMHSCCAPCSSASLEFVVPRFDVDLFFYNPNITDSKEYSFRLQEQRRFLQLVHKDVKLIEGEYSPDVFFETARGMESLKEGGTRCFSCYRLRLMETAKVAKELGYDFFASTLSVSPYKNSNELNRIGYEIAGVVGIQYLPTDFKKKDGYKRSIELSKQYNLYRQNYCGCEFSIR